MLRVFGRVFESCHFTHWTLSHLVWDLLMFVALGSAYETGFFLKEPLAEKNMRRAKLLFFLFAAGMVIPVFVLGFAPDILRYRGLSGLCVMLFMLVVGQIFSSICWREDRRLVLAVLVAVFVLLGKIAYEAWSGGAVFAELGNVRSAWEAHLAGFAVGSFGGVGGFRSSLSLFAKRKGEIVLLFRSKLS